MAATMETPKFGEYLTLLMDERGWSQQALATEAGVALHTIHRGVHAEFCPWRKPTITMVFHALDRKRMSAAEAGRYFDLAGIPELAKKYRSERTGEIAPTLPPKRSGSSAEAAAAAAETLPASTPLITAKCFELLAGLLHQHDAALVLQMLESASGMLSAARNTPFKGPRSGIRALHTIKVIDGVEYRMINPLAAQAAPPEPLAPTKKPTPPTARAAGG